MIKEFGVICSGLFILILIFSYASSANNFNALAQNTTVSNPTTNTTSTIGGVKITFPEKGANIPINSNSSFTIKGISKDNAATNCQVSVIVNNVKPYQNAQPMNKNGNGDYSEWQYTLTKNYTNIIEGPNKITAKFSCLNNPQSTHYSVNATGVNLSPEQLKAYFSPVESNITSGITPSSSLLTTQQPISQILASTDNSQSDPICCKTTSSNGGSGNNGGSNNNDNEDDDSSDKVAKISKDDSSDNEDDDSSDKVAKISKDDSSDNNNDDDSSDNKSIQTNSNDNNNDDDSSDQNFLRNFFNDNNNDDDSSDQNFLRNFFNDNNNDDDSESNDWDESSESDLNDNIMNQVEDNLQSAGINFHFN
jgi:hypothetical protein